MKQCILGYNFEGQGWSSRLYTILLIQIWELRYPSKKTGVNRKRGGSFENCSAWDGANYLLWGRKDLPMGPGVGGAIQINCKVNFIQDSCQRFSLHFKDSFY